MSYSVQDLKSDLTGILHGTSLNKVTGINNVINRSARQVLEDLDPQETKRIVQLSPVFDQVFDYPCPVDLKGNKIIDLRPQVNRVASEVWGQVYNQAFDLAKTLSLVDLFTINFNQAVKTLRIASISFPAGTVVNTISSLTNNGTWTNGGGATVPTVDNINFVAGGGSLQFNLSAGPVTGFIETTNSQAQNLSAQLNQGTEFLYVYLPDASAVSSVDLRWGSSNAAYYHRTVSVTQQNTAFQNGWNLLSFQWAGSTVVGVPNPASITYIRVTLNYNGALQTAVRVNDYVSALGSILECEYYSKYLFRDAITGAFQEKVTDDSNLINFDTESYSILLYQSAIYCAQQLFAKDSTFDVQFFENEYQKAVNRYMEMYKSEIQKPQAPYYVMPNASYSNYISRTWYRN